MTVALAALLLLLVSAPPALSHAALRGSTPAAGASLAQPPDEIRLQFSEPVATDLSRVEVRDGLGRVVNPDLGVEADEVTLRADLPGGGPDGVWSVEYRVLSVDGHLVVGGHTFLVGDAAVAQRLTSRGIDLARWGFTGAGVLLLVGAAVWLRRLAAR